MSNNFRKKRNKKKGKKRTTKKTRGERARDKSNILRLLGDDKVSTDEMLAFTANASKVFTQDALEDERAKNKQDWRKLSDAQRMRLTTKMRALVDRKDDFVIDIDLSKIPDDNDKERILELRLSMDSEAHDLSQHCSIQTGMDAACFWWWEDKGDLAPHIQLSQTQRNILYEKTTYNAFKSVIDRIWEDGKLVTCWRGKTWKDVLYYIEMNYGTTSVCSRLIDETNKHFFCFSLDKGGRYFACMMMYMERVYEENDEAELPLEMTLFPLTCPCKLNQSRLSS